MHVSAVAAAKAVSPSHELPQKADKVNSAHEKRRRSPVVKSHGIPILKHGGQTSGDRLFAYAQVHFAGNQALLPQLLDSLFKKPRAKHLPVKKPKVRSHLFLLNIYFIAPWRLFYFSLVTIL
jgi:hypothetical protein